MMNPNQFSKSEKLTFKIEWTKIINLLKRSRVDLSRIKLTTTMEVDNND